MTLTAIDISGWQAGIDLSKVVSDIVIIKATGSGGFVSPYCDAQFQQAKELGRLRGVYHYSRDSAGPAGDAVAEARFFYEHTKGYYDGMTVPVLDHESVIAGDPFVHNVTWALAWLNEVYRLTGIRPLIYLSNSVTFEADWSPVVKADYALWVAAYVLGYQQIQGFNVPEGLKTPGHWGGCAMWQYTPTGRLPGWNGDLDLNVYYGDKASWLRRAAKVGSAAVTAPAPAKPAPAKPAPDKPAPAAPAGSFMATVETGDTLTSIAAQFGTTVQAILAVNNIKDANRINAGQQIRIPGKAPAAPAKTSTPAQCIVEAGDTLSGIGQQFGVAWQTIASLNGLRDPYVIYPGQVLRLR